MPLHPYLDHVPAVAPDAWIAPGAQVIGAVTIGSRSSIWYNCVLRGDVMSISIGARTNIQDSTVIHVSTGLRGTAIGDDVLIGHMAILHGCTVGDRSFVGLGAIVMDECVIETEGMLAAGALLTPGKRIGPRELWTGRPARLARMLDDAEVAAHAQGVAAYAELAVRHRQSLQG
jgi:carbonic anhydrase/acetyltransferase-like protein (isoleucine patch superfamily)